MKKLISMNICLCLMILLLSGCHQEEKVLKLKYNDFHVELGNAIVKEPLCYLDLSELTDEQIDHLKENSQMTVHQSSVDLSASRNQYEPEGVYDCTIEYLQETLHFQINVVSHQDPIILGPHIIAVKKGNTQFDFDKYYDVKSPYMMKSLYVDTSQVDFYKVGDYSATVITTEMTDDSKQATRNIIVKVQNKVTYHIPKSMLLDVPYYNQMDIEAPNGCEATSLYMALKYKNKINIDVKTFVQSIPRAITPYVGFTGDPFSRPTQRGEIYTIFPQALIKATSQYTQMRDISGGDIYQIMDEIANNHPVIVWGTGGFLEPIMGDYYFGKVPNNIHIVLVNGYDIDKKVFYIQDPMNKDFKEVPFEQFEIAYNALEFAIAVEG